jgi:predicted RNA methylase
MTAQCDSISFAILQIQHVITHNPEGAFRLRSDTAFASHFVSVFGACRLVFSVINQRFQDMIDNSVNSHGGLLKSALVKYIWNTGEMNELLRHLNSQATAISLLLSALQM